MLVVGDKEAGGGPLTVRVRGVADQQMQEKERFIEEMIDFVQTRKT